MLFSDESLVLRGIIMWANGTVMNICIMLAELSVIPILFADSCLVQYFINKALMDILAFVRVGYASFLRPFNHKLMLPT